MTLYVAPSPDSGYAGAENRYDDFQRGNNFVILMKVDLMKRNDNGFVLCRFDFYYYTQGKINKAFYKQDTVCICADLHHNNIYLYAYRYARYYEQRNMATVDSDSHQLPGCI